MLDLSRGDKPSTFFLVPGEAGRSKATSLQKSKFLWAGTARGQGPARGTANEDKETLLPLSLHSQDASKLLGKTRNDFEFPGIWAIMERVWFGIWFLFLPLSG